MTEQIRLPRRPMQIHVTRKCNLKCLHCYSNSGPEETEALNIRDLRAAVTDAKSLGYSVISLSGGEPFLYKHLPELLSHAKDVGVGTGIVTNGMFLDKRRLDAIKDTLDILVVSLDGARARHNYMRAHEKAFDIMDAKLDNLRASGIGFGFLCTLTRETAHDLEWVADYAVAQGATALQIHPLDETGRARENAAIKGDVPDETVSMMAARLAARLVEKYEGKLRITLDFQPKLSEYHVIPGSCGRELRFSDIVTPLVIEPDGAIVPVGYGFNRAYTLGQLGEEPLRDLAERWKSNGQMEEFRSLVARAQKAAMEPEAPVLANMASVIRDTASQAIPA